jgi:hypothetical protein
MSSGNKIGARKCSSFMAICTTPSINKTPIGPYTVPLPYSTSQDLTNSVATTRTVRFNGEQAYVLDMSKQTGCRGDDPGTATGIRSATLNGPVTPTTSCRTVRCEGKWVVREHDSNTMNGGNNLGIYVTTQVPSGGAPKQAAMTCNPPIKPETPQEKSVIAKWWAKTKQELGAAVDQPVEGSKGAAKGLANTPSHLGDMLGKGSALHSASELEEAAMYQALFGQAERAKQMGELAQAMRANANAIDLPKFAMSNAAQAGGDKIATVIQLAAGGSGLVKGAAKGGSKLGSLGGAAHSVETVEQGAGMAARAAKPASVSGLGGRVSTNAELTKNPGQTVSQGAPAAATAGKPAEVVSKVNSAAQAGGAAGKGADTANEAGKAVEAASTAGNSAEGAK